jgi:hypothetical protein
MDLSQKTPFAVTITQYIQNKLDSNQEIFGLQLPCRVTAITGSIVTVNFEIDTGGEFTFPPVTCAIAESSYVQLPVQVGDYGICIAANTRLGGINGLGQGLAPLTNPLNLGGLVFVPISNANWSAVDPNAVNINAPNGVVLRDTNNNCTVTLVPSGVTVAIEGIELIVNAGGVTINGNLMVNGSISGTGGFHVSNNSGGGAAMNIVGNIVQTGTISNTGGITTNGDVVANGKSLENHEHTVINVQGGTSAIVTTAPN